MVWSGDLEQDGEKHLLDDVELPSGVQVWKAGHHGSDTSGSPEWVSRLDPGLILISCGVENSYGHPSHGWYLAAGDTISTVRTDLEGSIALDWDSSGALRWRTRTRCGQLPALP